MKWQGVKIFNGFEILSRFQNWRFDIQHNDTQHKDIQHNDTQYKDIQHNDIQHNDIQHNDIQYNDTQHNNKQNATFNIMKLSSIMILVLLY